MEFKSFYWLSHYTIQFYWFFLDMGWLGRTNNLSGTNLGKEELAIFE